MYEERFIVLGQEIEKVGRDVGGWWKGLITKTPSLYAREKRKE
jgi:hypothetical protein